MFSQILELLKEFWDWFKPFEMVMSYEGGVQLRRGVFHRVLGPGLWWKIPLLDYCLTCHTAITTMQLRPQTLLTKDGVQLVIAAIVKYRIRDPKPYLLDIWDSKDVLNDVTLGAIKHTINGLAYEQVVALDVEPKILEAVRREVNQFGFQILKITFVDQGKIKTIRILTSHDQDLREDGYK